MSSHLRALSFQGSLPIQFLLFSVLESSVNVSEFCFLYWFSFLVFKQLGLSFPSVVPSYPLCLKALWSRYEVEHQSEQRRCRVSVCPFLLLVPVFFFHWVTDSFCSEKLEKPKEKKLLKGRSNPFSSQARRIGAVHLQKASQKQSVLVEPLEWLLDCPSNLAQESAYP